MEVDKLDRFQQALISNQSVFELDLGSEVLQRLSVYYSLLTRWNPRLHLVAPCSPEEFATRHILESLMLLEHLPHGAKIADIGSGAGLPIIPCLVARPDLHATLIESSQKKSVFLREALNATSRSATIVARPFEDVPTPDVSFITCRALDEFVAKVPALLEWAPSGCTLLFYGGETLRQELNKAGVPFEEFRIPLSDRRFLFKANHG